MLPVSWNMGPQWYSASSQMIWWVSLAVIGREIQITAQPFQQYQQLASRCHHFFEQHKFFTVEMTLMTPEMLHDIHWVDFYSGNKLSHLFLTARTYKLFGCHLFNLGTLFLFDFSALKMWQELLQQAVFVTVRRLISWLCEGGLISKGCWRFGKILCGAQTKESVSLMARFLSRKWH